jgi:PKD repeat protein
MKRFLKYFLIVLFLLNELNCFSQLEAKNWYFGTGLAMRFDSSGPVPMNNSKMFSQRGSSSISDKDGNLLFYSDGSAIWNKNHDTMKNGYGLYGSYASLQSPLIVPMPGDSNLYYLFSVIDFTKPNEGFWFNIIDMRGDNGNGELKVKNQKICNNVSNHISATFHENRKSVWILVREWNSFNFKAYLLKNTGLDTIPVISRGKVFIKNSSYTLGQLKFSASGNKIANTICYKQKVEIADFNKRTGKISNSKLIKFDSTSSNSKYLFGCEISPNEKYLYVSGYGFPGSLYQLDISSGIESTIQNSIDTIYENYDVMWGNYYYCLQIGINKRIYIAKGGSYMGCINNPDKKGIACNYIDSAVSFTFPGINAHLPTFLQSYFFLPEIKIKDFCFGDSTVFSLDDTSNIDSVLWNFGDGDSLFAMSPTHIYSDTGYYQTQAIIFYDNTSDTFTREIRISNYALPDFYIPDTNQCLNSNSFHFFDSSASVDGSMTYEWEFGDSTKSFQQNPVKSYLTSDTFGVSLTVTSAYGCESSLRKEVVVLPSPVTGFTLSDSVRCFNNRSLNISNGSYLLNDSIVENKWILGQDTIVTNQIDSYSFSSPGSYIIQLITTTTNSCTDTLEKDFIIHPSPKASFSFNDSVQCFNTQLLDIYNWSMVVGDSLKESKWVLGLDTVVSDEVDSYTFKNPGTLPIQLIVVTKNNCRDTLVKDYILHPSPQADFVFNDSTQCFNEQLLAARNSSLVVGDSIMENLWYLSQDTLKTEDIIGYKFDNFGTYPVKLVVATSNDCKDSITKNIDIYKSPIADFSINDSIQCFNEQLLVARNSSLAAPNSIIENKWILNSDTVLSKDLENYTFDKYGNYPIKLIVTTKNGCRDTSTSYFVLHPSPIAKFTLDDSVQCFNEQSLVARNSSLVASDTITETKWILNSDTILANEITNYQFTQPGTYPIQLIVTTSNNCPDTLTKNFALFASPLADFAVNDSAQCYNEQDFQITNLSTIDNDLITQYSWYLNSQSLSFSGSPVLPVITPEPAISNSKQPPPTTVSIPSQKNSSFIHHPKQISNTNCPASTSLTNLLINPLLKLLELSTNGTGILEMGILKLIKTQKILTLHLALFKSFLLLHQIRAAPTLSLKSCNFMNTLGILIWKGQQ